MYINNLNMANIQKLELISDKLNVIGASSNINCAQ